MPQIAPWLDEQASFDPGGDFEAFVRAVPARWVVYLFADAQGTPIQLLCVKNLRASLKRRLGTDEPIGPSRRVNYRDLVRQVRWVRVDSAFEADWIYYETARRIFPQSYQGMLGFRSAWFVHVNPQSPFPRYIKTTDLARPGLYVGPFEDKHAATRLIQLVEDLFDLCRYYNILIEAPHAKACAYKEMGKCPAPCDGSISMDQYRHLMEWSVQTLIDPADAIRAHTRRMEQAAAELRFEAAAKIKTYIAQLSEIGKGPYRHARYLRDFRFLSLQPGPRAATVNALLITPGRIQPLCCVRDESAAASELVRTVLAAAENATQTEHASVDTIGTERIGIVAHHLFSPKATQGVFIHLDELDENAIKKAFRELRKRPPEEPMETEGVMKELQSF